ncbi:L-threonylcarbamoyladenylate synthase [Pediococcus argentinicus]|uniref:L-threonylcarbamoyladenylate synthase n=1 Tax=Pediococcus argentinicus TaxID=480391 RepID=UPI00338FEBC7
MSKIFSKSEINEAAQKLRDGELVAFPTETVYGLGADATNETAVKKVYLAKGRPSDNPLIVHVAGEEDVRRYATITPAAKKLMDQFWPGPLTIILPIIPGALSLTVTGGLKTAAFRNPANAATIELIKTAGVPLVGPSANTSGKPSPTRPEHVMHDLDGKIAGVLDDGETKIGVESTVIDMSGAVPTILRPGALTPAELEPVIGEIQTDHHKVGANEVPKAPGMKYKHYAPAAQVYIVGDSEWNQVHELVDTKFKGQSAVMAVDHVLNEYSWDETVAFSLGENVNDAAHNLFDGLRTLDNNEEIQVIFAQEFNKKGLGEAYMNRLEKSAGQQYLKNQAF